ncbi:hypothetical protein DESA109040_04260 [Deinococcus saxicola]
MTCLAVYLWPLRIRSVYLAAYVGCLLAADTDCVKFQNIQESAVCSSIPRNPYFLLLLPVD